MLEIAGTAATDDIPDGIIPALGQVCQALVVVTLFPFA